MSLIYHQVNLKAIEVFYIYTQYVELLYYFIF